MQSRYNLIPQVTGSNGKRVRRPVIYPPIPRRESDLYTYAVVGDRLDLLAKKHYNDVGLWWILAEANAIGKGNLAVPAGMQLRIPTDITTILISYEQLNA
jgi:hypothetical protein